MFRYFSVCRERSLTCRWTQGLCRLSDVGVPSFPEGNKQPFFFPQLPVTRITLAPAGQTDKTRWQRKEHGTMVQFRTLRLVQDFFRMDPRRESGTSHGQKDGQKGPRDPRGDGVPETYDGERDGTHGSIRDYKSLGSVGTEGGRFSLRNQYKRILI